MHLESVRNLTHLSIRSPNFSFRAMSHLFRSLVRREFIVFANGLKRSGNHIIHAWLAENLRLSPSNWVNAYNQHYKFREDKVVVPRYSYGRIYSFEDLTHAQFTKYVRCNKRFKTIGVHRAVSDMVSSRIVAFLGNEFRPAFDDYQENISNGTFSNHLIDREITLINDYFSGLEAYDHTICYESFISNAHDYRGKKLAEILGRKVEEKSRSLNAVPFHGWGSSFSAEHIPESETANYHSRKSRLTSKQMQIYEAIMAGVRTTNYPEGNLEAR
ncbi:MAG: hypothetical protein SynsKO_34950 [Synoicihabitans sp.]